MKLVGHAEMILLCIYLELEMVNIAKNINRYCCDFTSRKDWKHNVNIK